VRQAGGAGGGPADRHASELRKHRWSTCQIDTTTNREQPSRVSA
jgi:hypothetical protein